MTQITPARAECASQFAPLGESGQQALTLCTQVMHAQSFLPGELNTEGTPLGLVYSCARCLEGIGIGGVVEPIQGVAFFFKLLFKDMPSYAWDKSKQWVSGLFSSAQDPVSGAAAAADANASVYSDLMSAAKRYYQDFLSFVKQVGAKIDSEWQEFKCLPASLQTKLLCQMVTEAFMAVVTPETIIKNIPVAAKLATALNGTFQAIKESQLLQGGTLAEGVQRLGTAVRQGAQAMQEGTVLQKLGDSNLVEYVDASGKKILKLEKKVNGQWVSSAVALDARTGTILGSTEEGSELMQATISKAAREAGTSPTAVAMIDVNYLGKVNYFKDQMLAGNAYLKAVSSAIKSAVRDNDLVYRYGGDEFLVQMDRVSPQEARTIINRINKAVSESPEARAVFNAQRKALAAEYRAVRNASQFSDLPDKIAEKLTSKAKELAETDFPAFRSQYLESQRGVMRGMSKMRPTVSAGSTMVRTGDNSESVVQRASEQVGQVKGAYKAALGMDPGKYGTPAGEAIPSGPAPAVPDVLLPDQGLNP